MCDFIVITNVIIIQINQYTMLMMIYKFRKLIVSININIKIYIYI